MEEEFNILIIEDDDKTFDLLVEAFKKTKYKLWRVTTGKEALRLIKDVYFMAAISELHPLDINIIKLIKKIKKVDYRINIVLLAVYSFADTAVKALEAGAYAYLLKPLDIQEVKLILKRAIEETCLLIQAGKKKYFEDISILDGLTGLYNHRNFHEILDWHISHLRRHPQAFSLLMIDVDDFKKYNDIHGHVEGDKILRNAAKVFVDSTRETDRVFRYGGEEFSVLLPQTPQAQAEIVAKRIVEAVRSKMPVTISMGLATFPDHAQIKEDLVIKADKALYRAKALGKNRLCIYDKKLDK